MYRIISIMIRFLNFLPETSAYSLWHSSAAGVIFQLVLSNLAHCKVSGCGMCQHHAADGGVRMHGSMFSQRDAYLFHAEQFVQQEIHGLVG